ncbi:MAG: CHAT domain-containing protein [Caldilineaceae bacterium]
MMEYATYQENYLDSITFPFVENFREHLLELSLTVMGSPQRIAQFPSSPYIANIDVRLERIEKLLLPSREEINQKNIESNTRKLSILLLSAEPADTSRLRLGEEHREIQERLQCSQLRDQLELKYYSAVRTVDFTQALLDEKPSIVHFSGHGASSGEICVEDIYGHIHPLKSQVVSVLFKQFQRYVKCVILNACYSESQACAISEHIEYVIGMKNWITDAAAIAFCTGFYQALGAGCPIQEAYELGRIQVELQNHDATGILLLTKYSMPPE